MKAIFLGEVVGRAGLTSVKKGLKIEKYNHKSIPLCVANAQGAANGFGLTRDEATFLLNSGVDVLTGADKIFYKKDLVEFISTSAKIIRPLNMSPTATPGKGVRYIEINDEKCAIINIIGQQEVHMNALSSPYVSLDWIIPKLKEQDIKQIYVFLHAEATAEKKCLFYYLDGKVTAVIGTKTRVMTADSQVSVNGTAYITDNGRCGSAISVAGLEPEVEIKKERLGRVFYSKECFNDLQMQGVIVESDENGKAISIERVKERIELSNAENEKLNII